MRHWTADAVLRAPDQWRRRGDVLDRLEASGFQAEAGLSRQAAALREELEAIHRDFCATLRGAIRQGRGAEALIGLAAADEGGAPDDNGDGYDALDALLAEVLAPDAPSADIGELLPDMVFYQPTPARHLLALLRRLDLRESDVLIDLGSGLGHLPLLTAILTPARAIGIEVEAAYVANARRSADTLALDRIRFLAGDVRTADLSTGTVFYLYSPFGGAMLGEVLALLEQMARARPLRLATLGPCTRDMAAVGWLHTRDAVRGDVPVLFHSR
ncbi:hypothetical protein [Pseudoxanthomonas sp. z9]|uniref:hypothetical protein n=1 Tax=Pseudoxanthomonas sp. z9 TaxID=2584942 RepID=UPI001141B158|nr:hypothetical protein [Pseudoxanthomonas sp. z9]